MDVMKTVKWIADNYEMILNALVVVFGGLGVVVEGINRLLPTKSDASAMTKLGKFFTKAGEYVKKLMDFLKVPNVEKKDDSQQ
jgi:hypothetical protein